MCASLNVQVLVQMCAHPRVPGWKCFHPPCSRRLLFLASVPHLNFAREAAPGPLRRSHSSKHEQRSARLCMHDSFHLRRGGRLTSPTDALATSRQTKAGKNSFDPSVAISITLKGQPARWYACKQPTPCSSKWRVPAKAGQT